MMAFYLGWIVNVLKAFCKILVSFMFPSLDCWAESKLLLRGNFLSIWKIPALKSIIRIAFCFIGKFVFGVVANCRHFVRGKAWKITLAGIFYTSSKYFCQFISKYAITISGSFFLCHLSEPLCSCLSNGPNIIRNKGNLILATFN